MGKGALAVGEERRKSGVAEVAGLGTLSIFDFGKDFNGPPLPDPLLQRRRGGSLLGIFEF